MPGQKIIRLDKKGGGSTFPDAGFRRFSKVLPFPPRLFAKAKGMELKGFRPALFAFGDCFFARATRRRI